MKALLFGLIFISITIVGGTWAFTSPKPIRNAICAFAVVVVAGIAGIHFFWGEGDAPTAITTDRAIAVLPFLDLSPDDDKAFFAQGISDQIASQLTRVKGLRVIARTSVFSAQERNLDVIEIGKQLRVAYVLEGSVRWSTTQVRVNTDLIRTVDATKMWSQTYSKSLNDIFFIQDDIANEVAKQLQVRLLTPLPQTVKLEPDKLLLFLKAKQLARKNTADGYTNSDQLLRKVANEANYAPAWLELARNKLDEAQLGLVAPAEAFVEAHDAADKALQQNPDFAAAHAELGWIAMFGYLDLPGAAKEYELALSYGHSDPDTLKGAAVLLISLGRVNEGLQLHRAVARLDPLSDTAQYNLGVAQRWLGQYDGAIASLHAAIKNNPVRGRSHFQLGVALVQKGKVEEGFTEINAETNAAWRAIGLPIAYCALARKAEAERSLAQLTTQFETSAPYNIAYVYAFCGRTEKTFEWLDKAINYQDGGIADILAENLFQRVRTDSRWMPYLAKIGRSPEQISKIQFTVPPLE
jgi:TolB-like protein